MQGIGDPDALGRIPVAYSADGRVPRPTKSGFVHRPHPNWDCRYAGGLVVPVIQTERLLLTGFAEHHLEDFTRIQYDPRVVPWFGGDPDSLPTDPDIRRQDTWRVMATFLGHWAMRGHGQWALVDTATDRMIGRAGLWYPEGWPGLEVGWLVDPEHQRQSYATEAARAAIDFAFDHLGQDEVISITVPHNTASRRVMEKVGLTDTGTTVEVRGHTQVLYRITHRDWLASSSYSYS